MRFRIAYAAVLISAASAAAGAQKPLRHFTEGVETRYARSQPVLHYTLTIRTADTTGYDVRIAIRNARDTFRLAMAKHPDAPEVRDPLLLAHFIPEFNPIVSQYWLLTRYLHQTKVDEASWTPWTTLGVRSWRPKYIPTPERLNFWIAGNASVRARVWAVLGQRQLRPQRPVDDPRCALHGRSCSLPRGTGSRRNGCDRPAAAPAPVTGRRPRRRTWRCARAASRRSRPRGSAGPRWCRSRCRVRPAPLECASLQQQSVDSAVSPTERSLRRRWLPIGKAPESEPGRGED